MIERTQGDLLMADSEALVNTVNCVGVMGKGLALQFKKAFPENFKAYEAACRREEVRPGRMFVFETEQMFNPRYIRKRRLFKPAHIRLAWERLQAEGWIKV